LKYASGSAFRRALEERIRRNYQGKDVPRIRKMIAFERLMARLDQHWILKGGYAVQLRTQRARTTQDVDLLVMDIPVEDLENIFRKELEIDLGDFFDFIVPKSTDAGIGEHSMRYQVITRVAGRVFERFHVDIGFNDPLLQPIDYLTPPNFLAFAQVEPAMIPCYSIYQHIAEKIHAIWLPRTIQSSRVKDFVDLILMAGLDTYIQANILCEVIGLVFESRGDQMPQSLDSFPANWQQRYILLAKETQLHLLEFQKATEAVAAFITPVLSQQVVGLTWDPKDWQWKCSEINIFQNSGSTQIRLGAPTRIHSELCPTDVEQFLEMIRFDQRKKLAELPGIPK
jgi:hypothetical protein